MRQGLRFPRWAKQSEHRTSRRQRNALGLLGSHNRRLVLEELEDRRLLSVAPPTILPLPPGKPSRSNGRPPTWQQAATSACATIGRHCGTATRHWIEIGQVAAANGSEPTRGTPPGMAPGTYYIGGYLWSGAKPTYSHLTQSITIAAALMVDASTAPEGSPQLLTDQQLAPIVVAAEQRLAAELGSTAVAGLAGMKVEVADLPAGMLGEEVGGTILIDRDAAGYGWFVDLTPNDDAEFVNRIDSYSLAAAQGTAAYGRADLLTTVMHEMGHLLGYGHSDNGDLMTATLPLGVRRTTIAELGLVGSHSGGLPIGG